MDFSRMQTHARHCPARRSPRLRLDTRPHAPARARVRPDREEGGSRRRRDLSETRGTEPNSRRVDGSCR